MSLWVGVTAPAMPSEKVTLLRKEKQLMRGPWSCLGCLLDFFSLWQQGRLAVALCELVVWSLYLLVFWWMANASLGINSPRLHLQEQDTELWNPQGVGKAAFNCAVWCGPTFPRLAQSAFSYCSLGGSWSWQRGIELHPLHGPAAWVPRAGPCCFCSVLSHWMFKSLSSNVHTVLKPGLASCKRQLWELSEFLVPAAVCSLGLNSLGRAFVVLEITTLLCPQPAEVISCLLLLFAPFFFPHMESFSANGARWFYILVFFWN